VFVQQVEKRANITADRAEGQRGRELERRKGGDKKKRNLRSKYTEGVSGRARNGKRWLEIKKHVIVGWGGKEGGGGCFNLTRRKGEQSRK